MVKLSIDQARAYSSAFRRTRGNTEGAQGGHSVFRVAQTHGMKGGHSEPTGVIAQIHTLDADIYLFFAFVWLRAEALRE
jgi:hypothetical protein